jgi:hypothetical protein
MVGTRPSHRERKCGDVLRHGVKVRGREAFGPELAPAFESPAALQKRQQAGRSKRFAPILASLHCNSRSCSQAASIPCPAGEPQNHGRTESYWTDHAAPPLVVLPAIILSLFRMILSGHDSVFFQSVAAPPRCALASLG